MRKAAADSRAGNAGEEFEIGDARLARGQGDIEVERAGACLDTVLLRGDVDKAAAETHHDAFDPAIAHEQVRGHADHGDHRHIRRLGREKSTEIRHIGRTEQHLSRPADAEPRHRRKRRVSCKPAPHFGQPVDEMRRARRRQSSWTRSGRRALLELAGQALRPVGDRAGAEAHHEIARLRQSGDGRGERVPGAESGTTWRWPRARRPSTRAASRDAPSIGASP